MARKRTHEEKIADRLLLLYLVNTSEEPIGDTKLQKLAYLSQLRMQQQDHKGFTYSFIKLPYGPYSEDLEEDTNILEKNGLITPFNHRTTHTGKTLLNKLELITEQNTAYFKKIKEVNEKYSPIDRNELVRIVHKMRNPDKPNLTIHQTKTGWYILKRPKLKGAKNSFILPEQSFASLEILLNPDALRSMINSIKEARNVPSVPYGV